MLNLDKIREDFCQCSNPFEGNVITYFDSAATTLKPKQVVDAVNNYYLAECSNVHRGIHTLSEVSTNRFEATRDKVKELINSKAREEVIFTKGATEALNLVASSYAEAFLKPGDEILISEYTAKNISQKISQLKPLPPWSESGCLGGAFCVSETGPARVGTPAGSLPGVPIGEFVASVFFSSAINLLYRF